MTEQVGLKRKGRARTLAEPVTDALWEAHLAGVRGIGVVPIDEDSMCRWGAIDVDIYDELNLAEIERRIDDRNWPLVPCETKSGGLHLFVFLSEPVEAAAVQSMLEEFAVGLGFGGAEVFPKQTQLVDSRDFGNWLNMPYFGDERRAVRGGRRLLAEEFLAYAAEREITPEAVRASVRRNENDPLVGAPPCLRRLAADRLGSDAGRNKALFAVAVYAKRRWPDSWEDQVVAYNDTYFNIPLKLSELHATVIKSVQKKDYHYPCKQSPLVERCDREACLRTEWGVKGDDDPGVTIQNLRKSGHRWYVTVSRQEVVIDSTDGFITQDRFRHACAEQIHVYPNRVPVAQWDAIIQTLLADVQVMEIPPEATEEGALWETVVDYCAGGVTSQHVQDIKIGGIAMVDDHYVFLPSALVRWCHDQGLRRLDRNKLWDVVRKRGGESLTEVICGARMVVWRIPRGEIRSREQTEDYDVRIPPGEM